MSRSIKVLAAAALLSPLAANAQPSPGKFDFTVANIMRGPELYGREPQGVSWSADGQWVYFQWNPPGTKWDEPSRPYRVRAVAGATPERLTDAQMDSVAPLIADGPRSRDGLRKVVSARGDLYVIVMKKGTSQRLTQTLSAEADPRFSADEKSLLFTRDGNAFVHEFATGLVKQLTDVRPGPAPREDDRVARP